MNVRPLNDRVIVERHKRETTSKGGVILTSEERSNLGTVLAIGPKTATKGGEDAVKVGDTVLFGPYTGQSITVGDTETIFMRDSDIMAVVDRGRS